MTQAEILAAQTGGQQTSKNTQLVSREQWEDSPLTICGIEEGNKWFIALGIRRVTDYYQTKDEIITLLKEKQWELIIIIIAAVTEDTVRYLKEQEQKEDKQEIKDKKLTVSL